MPRTSLFSTPVRRLRRAAAAIAAAAVVAACAAPAAHADVVFSDGSTIATRVGCSQSFGTTDYGFYPNGNYTPTWTKLYSYSWDAQEWNEGPWREPGMSFGSAGIHAGWIAYYAYYAHWTGSGWEYGGEWVNTAQDGNQTGTPWCYT